MYESEIREAVRQVRIGESRAALGTLTAGVTSAVARCMPIYSDILQQSMQHRRIGLAAALKAMAIELQSLATAIIEGKSDISQEKGATPCVK